MNHFSTVGKLSHFSTVEFVVKYWSPFLLSQTASKRAFACSLHSPSNNQYILTSLFHSLSFETFLWYDSAITLFHVSFENLHTRQLTLPPLTVILIVALIFFLTIIFPFNNRNTLPLIVLCFYGLAIIHFEIFFLLVWDQH